VKSRNVRHSAKQAWIRFQNIITRHIRIPQAEIKEVSQEETTKNCCSHKFPLQKWISKHYESEETKKVNN
jgi:hypothetical protein